MIKLYDGQVSDLLDNGAKHNPEIRALSYAALKEKQRIIDEAQKTRTLALIDELPESVLDILAVELRTPFYQEDFSIEAKRDLIKNTLIFYMYCGTPEAVNRMLSAVFPGSYIEEWFTYGGDPYHFQIILETPRYRECANASAIVKSVKKVKRLTAHLDGLIYQCNIGIAIRTHAQGYKYNANFTGQTIAGTEPWRNKRGGFENGVVEVTISANGYDYKAPAAGTVPWRDVLGGLEHEELEIGTSGIGWAYTSNFQEEAGTESYRNKKGGWADKGVSIATDTDDFGYSSDPAGTKPKRSTLLQTTDAELDILAERTAYEYETTLTGQTIAGTEPWRNEKGGYSEGSVKVEADSQALGYSTDPTGTKPKRSMTTKTEPAEINVLSEGTPYGYTSEFTGKAETGTKPSRELHFGNEDEAIQVTTATDSFSYKASSAGEVEAGTEPQRNEKGGELFSAFFTTVEGESYRYRITMCGTSYCRNKRRRSLC